MALAHTPTVATDRVAPDFNLPGVNGKHYALSDVCGPSGLLVMFICNHCPYVQAIRGKIVRDANDVLALGVGVVVINANDATQYPADSFDKMVEEARRYAYPFPYLWDESQVTARAYGAVCTPDFFGYNADLKLQYRGRLDDAGARRDMGERPRELFLAMKQIAQSGLGPQEQFPSLGCSIKWR